jgi:hypothetical protein
MGGAGGKKKSSRASRGYHIMETTTDRTRHPPESYSGLAKRDSSKSFSSSDHYIIPANACVCLTHDGDRSR